MSFWRLMLLTAAATLVTHAAAVVALVVAGRRTDARADRTRTASAHLVLAAVSAFAFAGGVVFGIWVIVSK